MNISEFKELHIKTVRTLYWCKYKPSEYVIEPGIQIYLIFVYIFKQLFSSKHLCDANELTNQTDKKIVH